LIAGYWLTPATVAMYHTLSHYKLINKPVRMRQ
jgi:hypothetical protein